LFSISFSISSLVILLFSLDSDKLDVESSISNLSDIFFLSDIILGSAHSDILILHNIGNYDSFNLFKLFNVDYITDI
jgi:hypothetical protein